MKGIGTKALATGQPFKQKTDDDCIKEMIYNVLSVRKGEKLGNPTSGTDIYKFLFSPNVDSVHMAIRMELAREVEEQIPMIKILNIDLLQDEETHSLSVFVIYQSLLTNSLDNVIIGGLNG